MALRLAWRQVSGGWFPRSLGRDGSWLLPCPVLKGPWRTPERAAGTTKELVTSGVICQGLRTTTTNKHNTSTNPIAEFIAPRLGSSSMTYIVVIQGTNEGEPAVQQVHPVPQWENIDVGPGQRIVLVRWQVTTKCLWKICQWGTYMAGDGSLVYPGSSCRRVPNVNVLNLRPGTPWQMSCVTLRISYAVPSAERTLRLRAV